MMKRPKNTLPPGYALRSLTANDLPAVQELLNACESAETGEPCVHEMDIVAEARGPALRLDDNAWLIVAPDGSFAGVGWLWAPREDSRELTADHYVHPGHRDTVLDDVLIDLVEARAAQIATQPEGQSLRGLVMFADVKQVGRCSSFIDRGFSHVRDLCCMRTDLDPSASRVSSWPDGITVRTVEPERDGRRLHAADEEAFSEHYLFFATPFEEWRLRRFDRDDFDPSLWLVAWDRDEIAGQVWAIPRGAEVFIEDLSVRKRWRGRGLGAALLSEVFGLLAARGHTLVRLFVDVQNITGAIRVYERVGMRAERRFEAYEKPLHRS